MIGRYINPYLERWTVALRRRRQLRETLKLRKASGQARTFKQDHSKRCQNCGASLTGPFCHLCGQKDGDMRRPIWEFTEELLDAFARPDSKTMQTLAMIMIVPGGLTRSYMDGRRARFIPPIRLFIIAFFTFFFIINVSNIAILDVSYKNETEFKESIKQGLDLEALKFDRKGKVILPDATVPVTISPRYYIKSLTPEDQRKFKEASKKAGFDIDHLAVKPLAENLETIDDYTFFRRLKVKILTPIESDENRIPIPKEDLESIINADDEQSAWVEKLRDGLARSFEDPMRFNELLNDRAQWALILYMPIFAVMLRFFHWRKDQRLMHQVVFSLHYHAFLMLLLILLIPIVQYLGGDTAFKVLTWGSIGYLFIALKIGQNQGWIKTFFKFLALWPLYFISLAGLLIYSVIMGVIEG